MSRRALLLGLILVTFPLTENPYVFSQRNPQPPGEPAPVSKPEVTEIPIPSSEPEAIPASSIVEFPQVKFLNFITSSITDLQHELRDLRHLKVASDQSQLPGLLEKIGAATKEVSGRTPDLISHESVASEVNGFTTNQEFSYLVLVHPHGPQATAFEEFRVDLKTGQKFEMEDIQKAANGSPKSSSLELPTILRKTSESASAPLSQGFANDWLYFYPSNRRQSEFRYLGDEKMDGRQTFVVAFAQKPGSVPIPARVGFADKQFIVYLQGIAWIDESDFRIVRLRTSLLSAPSEVPLHELTADIHFGPTHVAGVAYPLWLPDHVTTLAKVAATSVRERHTYTNYRLFRAKSKILLNP